MEFIFPSESINAIDSPPLDCTAELRAALLCRAAALRVEAAESDCCAAVAGLLLKFCQNKNINNNILSVIKK